MVTFCGGHVNYGMFHAQLPYIDPMRTGAEFCQFLQKNSRAKAVLWELFCFSAHFQLNIDFQIVTSGGPLFNWPLIQRGTKQTRRDQLLLPKLESTDLRIFQHTPGTYPRPPTNGL